MSNEPQLPSLNEISDLVNNRPRVPDVTDAFREMHRAQAARDRDARKVAKASEYQLVAAQMTAGQVAAQIAAFEAGLRADEEAFLCVVGGPAGLIIFPRGIEALPPDKLMFTGEDQDGHRVSVIQHVSQLSMLLKAVPVPKGEAPRRTGFHHPGEDPR